MISAMVLAAGKSRRMGTQKLLLPLQGKPIVAHAVDELLRSPVDQVLVVVGEEKQLISDALIGRNVRFVTNSHAGEEMLYSVRCGLAAMPEGTTAIIVALGDQPGITADVVAALIRSYHTTDRGIVVPTHKGKRGHPLLFAMHYRDEILARYEGDGLRELLAAHPEDVFTLEVDTSGILEDIDLPEDYRIALGHISKQDRN